MLKIRMQRSGRINQPSFRIVVTEHTSSPKAGKYVERVGFYNPQSKERTLVEDRIKYWMSVGAKPSSTIHNMLVSAGLLKAKKVNVLPRKTVKPAPTETSEVAKAQTPEGVEVPTEASGKTEAEASEAPAEAAEQAVEVSTEETPVEGK